MFRQEDSPVSDANPEDTPAYTVAEAAQWLGVSPSTVRAWVKGQRYRTPRGSSAFFEPVIEVADPENSLLSFRNLVELHVLVAIRRTHMVSLQKVRRAVDFLKQTFGVDRPLADRRLFTDRNDLFVRQLESLVNVSRSGQLEFEELVKAYLSRVEFGEAGEPRRLYPFSSTRIEGAARSVVIDPRVQFGRPCLVGTGVPTTAVAERFAAGESIAEIAADYGREISEIEEAVRYERLAA